MGERTRLCCRALHGRYSVWSSWRVFTFAVFAANAGETPKVALAPVSPTVPQPVPPGWAVVRFQNLVPAQAVKLDEKPNPFKMVETGPELTLGECIAIAVENSPNLKAVRASTAATEAGYRAINNFGTVGTLISPDLEIRKQQAQRGLTGTAGEYQRVHNEVVQDCTRMYYTAVFARQQQGIADRVVENLAELSDLIKKVIDTAKLPEDLGGLSTAKLLVARMGLKKAQSLQSTASHRPQAGHGRTAAESWRSKKHLCVSAEGQGTATDDAECGDHVATGLWKWRFAAGRNWPSRRLRLMFSGWKCMHRGRSRSSGSFRPSLRARISTPKTFLRR